jgi:phosphoglycerate dehydrogenase-like enzyme
MRVAFLDDFHAAYEETSGVRRLRENAEVTIFTQKVESASSLAGFDALVATRERTRFASDLFEQLSDVRIIAQTGNHAYHIDLVDAERRGIIIGKATGGFCTAAGELAFGLMMASMRQISAVDQAMKGGSWPTPMTRVLRGKTLGIVGLGNIGRYVAKIANAFDMKVLAWGGRLTDKAAGAVGAKRVELDDLLQNSDVVSIHATLSDNTRGLIDRRRIGLMKRSAYLINTARGAIVEESALVEALCERRLAGAGLDVFEEEPLSPNHPLRALDNVVLTSHLGWPTDEMYEQFAEAAADVLIAYKEGRPVPHFSSQH